MGNNISFLFLAGTLGHGGAEKQLFLLTKTLISKSHHVTVITFGEGDYWESKIKSLGIQVFSIKSRFRLFRVFEIIYICFLVKPDIFYSYHFYTSGYVGLVSKLFRNVKSIGSVRNDGYSEVKSNGFWSKYHMNLPDIIIGNSQQGLDAIHSLLRIPYSKLYYIANSIEIHTVNPRLERYSSEILRLVFVGRLVSEKNPQMFVQICNELKKLSFSFEAEIYGEGNLKEILLDLIKKYELFGCVKICDINPNICYELNNYDLLISTSFNEGTPNVLLEAINAEIPFLTIRNTAATELIEKKFLLKEFIFTDVENAVNLCTNYYKNKSMYFNIIKKAKNILQDSYSSDAQYKEFRSILDKNHNLN